MNRRYFQFAVGLLWLMPVVVLAQHWMVWDQLPAMMATHFNGAGQPNGWMSKESAAIVPAVVLLPLLIIATVFLLRVRQPEAGTWAIVGVFYLIGGAMVAIVQQVIAFNLRGTPIHPVAVVMSVLAGVMVCVGIFLASKRGRQLETSPVVAEEVHVSRLWTLIMILPLTPMIVVSLFVPDANARWILLAVSCLLLVAAAFIWQGFRYRFTRAGVEILTLGFRLRSIPKESIRSYAVAKWSMLGGYGIRGIGADRAYVWGNRGVRIVTSEGCVFLGHDDPQRLIGDLDMITGGVHAQA